MKTEWIKSPRLGESYVSAVHPSGLKIYIYPKKGFHSTYAIFGADYGSIHTTFKSSLLDEIIEVPAGIAHYLEHKLFESEDGDAFARYAKTGANANAYTSFDMTGYLFSCPENFEESLAILLDFVQSPYFTEQTVQKEQGIIGQEIKMYDDDPDWRVMFNLLQAMYHNHPVKIDIAGSIESIAEITAEKLYQCYETYYNLNNMALCIAGDVDPEKVLEFVNAALKDSKKVEVESIFPHEPLEVVKQRVEQKFEIATPMFQLGFKEAADQNRLSVEALAQTEILLDVMASQFSPMYQELLDKALINTASFGYQYFEGPGYASVIFSGESKDPDAVAAIIRKEAERLHKEGIAPELFELAKKSVYGRNIAALNSTDNIANILLRFAFAKREIFSFIDYVASVTLDDVTERLKKQLHPEFSALSIVSPK